jgi:hypothetical protein
VRLLVGVVLLAASCARRLAPIDVRTVSRVNEVRDIDKDTAYSRALVWFENNHDRAGIRVTSSDPATAAIVGSGEMQCNSSVGSGLRAMGLGFNQNYLRFNVEFQAKDDRFRVAFTELYYYIHDVRYDSSNLQQGPSNQADVDALYRDCLKDLEASLVQAVGGRAAAPDF